MTLDELKLKTMSLIGEAGTGEDYKKASNLAGDQDGYELRARRYYIPKIGWGKVYRIIGKNGVQDWTYADQLATLMEKALANGFIGYDTGHVTDPNTHEIIDGRNTFYYALQDAEYNPAAVTINCETDCSALVYAMLYSLTGIRWDGVETEGSEILASAVVSPQVRNFDHYLEHQFVNLQPDFQPARTDVYDIQVFTIERNENRLPIPDPDHPGEYLPARNMYNTYYDSVENDHLHVNTSESNLVDYLQNGHTETINHVEVPVSLLRRGDIIRTITPNDSGHIVIWL